MSNDATPVGFDRRWSPEERLELLDNKEEWFRHIAEGAPLLCADESFSLLQAQLQSEMERHLDAVESILSAHRLLMERHLDAVESILSAHRLLMERHLDAVESILSAHRLLRGKMPKEVRDRFRET